MKIFTLSFILFCCWFVAWSQTNDVTFRVDMNEYGGAFTTAHVNGTFNGWCGECNPLSDDDMDGVWEVTLPLPDSLASIEFKFTVDGWTDQEMFVGGEACTVTNGGFTNRFLEIDGDEDLPLFCFNSCNDCSFLQEFNFVTFRVDGSDMATAPDSMYLNGPFNGWCGTCTPMNDDDDDNIWEVTVPFDTAIDTMEYKFTANGTDWEDLAAGTDCTLTTDGFTNRLIVIDGSVALPAVCFGACESCDNSAKNNVTFQVDMNDYTGTFDVVNLNGNFAGWCGGCIEMYDNDGDGVYEVIVPVPDTIEYKFTVDAWTDDETLTAGLPCTKTTDNFTNRYLEPMGDTVLDAVCWESCDACGQSSTAMVTFNVDMNSYAGTFDFVNVSGIFNGWCGDCAQMTDDDGDGIYSLTAPIAKGEIEWKFTMNNWEVQEEFMGGESCTRTLDGFTNRFMEVTDDVVLENFCFNHCVTCDLVSSVDDLFAEAKMTLFPNPTDGLLNVRTQNALPVTIEAVRVHNLSGQLIQNIAINQNNLDLQINTADFGQGLFLLEVLTAEGNYFEKFVVK